MLTLFSLESQPGPERGAASPEPLGMAGLSVAGLTALLVECVTESLISHVRDTQSTWVSMG